MACGERYYNQYVAPDPGVWVDMNEVQAALSRLRLLRAALVLVWNKIVTLENGRGSWPWWEQWKEPLSQWMDRDQFPAQFGYAESLVYEERGTFNNITAVARDGVCLLDRMVTQAEQLYGAETPNIDPAPQIYTPPPESPWGLPSFGSLVPIAIALVVGLVVLGRRSA